MDGLPSTTLKGAVEEASGVPAALVGSLPSGDRWPRPASRSARRPHSQYLARRFRQRFRGTGPLRGGSRGAQYALSLQCSLVRHPTQYRKRPQTLEKTTGFDRHTPSQRGASAGPEHAAHRPADSAVGRRSAPGRTARASAPPRAEPCPAEHETRCRDALSRRDVRTCLGRVHGAQCERMVPQAFKKLH